MKLRTIALAVVTSCMLSVVASIAYNELEIRRIEREQRCLMYIELKDKVAAAGGYVPPVEQTACAKLPPHSPWPNPRTVPWSTPPTHPAADLE